MDVGKGAISPKFIACLVILCFERRCRKQNTIARLKSKDLTSTILWAGYATYIGTRRDKQPKKLEAINGTFPWKVFIASQGIENDLTKNVMDEPKLVTDSLQRVKSQWLTSPAHPLNFWWEIRLYCGNAILEILYSRLKKKY